MAIHAAYRRAKSTILDETGGAGVKQPLFALTSLFPSPDRAAVQWAAIRSWRDAGLQVRSFNHPSEIKLLAPLYDIEFVPVTNTTFTKSGSHYVLIGVMLNWAAARDARALIVSSDIELRFWPWELQRVRWLSEGGLCYFVRHNHEGTRESERREPDGIDACLIHGRDAALFPESFLSMGQPFWDYWLPYTLRACGRGIFAVEFPAAFHRNHDKQWSWEDWHRCALEFDRLAGVLGADRSMEACQTMSKRMRHYFDQDRVALPPRPMEIRPWLQRTFCSSASKTFLELGAHGGEDTAWMAALPGVSIHAFEPDPHNHPPPLPNVTLHRAAVADRDGSAPLILSKPGWCREWTESSSIKVPKNHLTRYPVSFGETVEVRTVALDSFCRSQGLGAIDFIGADIQGAEAEMIRGGGDTLARTHYLYTEYSDDELYENQPALADILEMLPDFRVLEVWPENVLLENTRFSG